MSLKNITPIMTSNTTPSEYMVKTSSNYSDEFMGWKAFDNVVEAPDNNGWITTNGSTSGEWIEFIYPSKIQLSLIKIASCMFTSRASEIAISISEDGKTYVTIEPTIILNYDVNDQYYHTHNFHTCVETKHIKITIKKSIIPDQNTGFSNIQFYFDDIYTPKDTISFHKTLTSNLPIQIEESKNEVHFTESGGIYINKKDGTFIQCKSGQMITELSNPLSSMPLEYGVFELSNRQTTDLQVGQLIKFDKVSNGNIPIENYKVKLKKGKTYRISISLVIQSERCDVQIKNLSTNQFIGKKIICIPPTSTFGFSTLSNNTFLYTPDSDCEIGAVITESTSSVIVFDAYSSLTIEEFRNIPAIHYGGFQTQTLFEGSASIIGDFNLSDSVSNYDYIEVYCGISETSNNKFVKTNNRTLVKDIEFLNRECFYVSIINFDGLYKYNIGYTFINETTLSVKSIQSKGWAGPHIYKVVGVKGQLPTLMSGGEF